ncbi:MAG: squalene synthase HpnC [Ignavibacteriae bacterium HGW-Ignavibacteriae-4]|jgi:squalene synthase HpnC|nr:MAG: squalene synthase HpnC [Ignavibacteriae bacterium HGW-Ignavibacteriae-4]
MKYNFDQLTELSKPSSDIFKTTSTEEAYLFCEKLAKSHYENFPVGSILIPKSIRHHFYSIYAFSRLADDIADENLTTEPDERYELLEALERGLDSKLDEITSPILRAVLNTCKETKVKINDLKRLIVAFKMDVRFEQTKDWNDLYIYCSYSANPIGEMLLKLFGENTDENIKLSDDVCTALQLVNFWQDISRDKVNERYYIPLELVNRFGLDYTDLKANPLRLQVCLDQLYQETEKLFENGKKLVYLVKNKRLKMELRLIISSGIRILEKCKSMKTEIVSTRPSLDVKDAFIIIINAIRI